MAEHAHITRRAAVRGLVALPAAAMSVEANVPKENIRDGTLEPLGERIRRLTQELSAALDELNAPTFATDFGGDMVGVWMARVWPSRVWQHVSLDQEDVPLAMVRIPAGRVRS